MTTVVLFGGGEMRVTVLYRRMRSHVIGVLDKRGGHPMKYKQKEIELHMTADVPIRY